MRHAARPPAGADRRPPSASGGSWPASGRSDTGPRLGSSNGPIRGHVVVDHAAYDSRILGVSPHLVVEIREGILEETDGPLLEHGLKALHGSRLRMVPRSRRDRPDEELLTLRYQRFLTS